MSVTPADKMGEKRKRPVDAPSTRKKGVRPLRAHQGALMAPHEAVVGALGAKHDVLVASVISSTQIRKRIELVVAHVAAADDKPRLAMLHARTAQVCKMITVVEQCKRILADKGQAWYQYNQLFDQPADPRRLDVVEETVLSKAEEDSGHDDFEIMSSHLESAVLPPPTTRPVKSMRVFLATQPISELENKDGLTVQSSKEPTS